jgi:molybdopterin-guanine dinucleotide biosynthesis protein MobB
LPPIISIVGESKSGKTTLIERLISELKSRGYRVATIKHSVHRLGFDKPGKDSWRHLQAGSSATAIVSPDKVVLIKPVTGEPDLNEIARLVGEDFDIILTEGFKQGSVPKLEIHRKAAGPLLNRVNNLIAIATDEPLETSTKQLPLNDIKTLADFLESVFIKSRGAATC